MPSEKANELLASLLVVHENYLYGKSRGSELEESKDALKDYIEKLESRDKNRRQSRKARDLCSRCGNKGLHTKTMCKACAEVMRAKASNYRKKAGDAKQEG